MKPVVSGLGIVSSIGVGPDEFRSSLRDGRIGVGIRETETSDVPLLAADLKNFDAAETINSIEGVSEALKTSSIKNIHKASPGIQASLCAALQAWEGAALEEEPVRPERIALVVSGHNLTNQCISAMSERYADQPRYLPPRYAIQAMDTNCLGVISEALNIRGEGYLVGAASASGNMAIINAGRLLENDLADACLVVGAMAEPTSLDMQAFINLGAMKRFPPNADPAECYGPFDADSDGFVHGQAAACMVLESQRSVKRRHQRAMAGYLGGCIRLDANSQANPDKEGEIGVMRGAIGQAGLRPENIAYVNAHGTGSPLGDRTEADALDALFDDTPISPWINSTKGFCGHCLYSAGVVEAVATVLQIDGGFVHGNANLRKPISERCRFAAQTSREQLDYALSNAFGFGGFNSAVIFSRAGIYEHDFEPGH